MGKAKKTTSKPRQVRIHIEALRDLADIGDYIGVAGQQPLNAIKVLAAIEATIDRIGQNPFVYKECEEIPTRTKIYRKAVCLSWLIIYKITDTEIVVLGVIHKARQPATVKAKRKLK